jgi:hypothetical protein
MLISMFAHLNDRELATMARLLNSLSAGQIVLALQLLEKFKFGVGSIEQSIPAASIRGSTFNIGPYVRVTVGGGGLGAGVVGGVSSGAVASGLGGLGMSRPLLG